jgi:putative transposase
MFSSHIRETIRLVADYNGERPHCALKYQTPVTYAAILTARAIGCATPTSSAHRPLLHPRQSTYNPTGL